MNARLLGRTSLGSFLIAAALISLTGCQLLGSQQDAINDSVVVASASMDFGKVGVGNSKTMQNKLTNFKTSSVTIVSIAGQNSDFQVSGITLPLILGPGQEAQFSVQCEPVAVGQPSTTISFGDNTQFLASFTATGNAVLPGQLSFNPSSVNFGNVKVQANKNSNVTLSNTGATNVTITQASLSGAGFSIGNLALPLTLQPGGTASLSATFAPTSPGHFTGSVSFSTYSGPVQTAYRKRTQAQPPASNWVLALDGTGMTSGTLAANPTSIAFGNVQVGGSSSKSETLTNTGGSSLTISQANVTGAGLSITGLALPATLVVNQSIAFTVKFTPAAAGAVAGNLAILSDASNSTLNIALDGTGIGAGQLSASPPSLAFGSVQIGNSSTKSETLTNTGGTAVTISQLNVTGAAYSVSGLTLPATLPPSQSATFTVTFAPTAAGSATGTLAIVSDSPGSPLNIGLSGTGAAQGQITPNPASLSFGNVVVGSSKTLTETLTNSGGSILTISAASANGAGFSLSGLSLPLALNAGQSTTFSVKFTPAATGGVSGNIAITSNGANPNLNIAISGAGVAPGTLSANPTSLAFGSVQVGSNASLSETLTNTGGSNVTISQANVIGAGFSVTGLSLPATVAPSQSVTFSVKFAPAAAGAVSGNLAIVSDASNTPLNLALSATGVAPGQITPNPSSLSFGNVQVGSAKTLTETLTNSGGSILIISAATASGSGVSLSGLSLPLTLNAGQSSSFTVHFAPTAAGAVSGNVAITSNGANPNLNIPVSGTGVGRGTLSANPTSLSFGTVQVGNTASLSETLTNTGGSAVTISQANVTGAGFSITGLTLPTTLTAAQSVTFTVKFSPTATGAASGNLAILSDASNSTLNVALAGSGAAAGQLSVSPGTLSFGNVVVNTSASLNGSLTATGASVTVTSDSSSNSEFVVSGIALPKTIAAGQSASFTVTFTPNASGAASASLTFLSNASNSPTVELLTGTGQAALPHSVDLSWTASQSQGVVGYNIYRGTLSGGPYSKVNSTLDANTAYTDDTVIAGQTYYYVAKAVDGNDLESGPSNEVQAVIPTP